MNLRCLEHPQACAAIDALATSTWDTADVFARLTGRTSPSAGCLKMAHREIFLQRFNFAEAAD